VFKKLTNSPH